MVDDQWTEALKEAYASAPVDDIILSTIELRHSSFVDESSNPVAIRMVCDYGSLLYEGDGDTLTDIYGHNLLLEDDAPMNPGETVTFVGVMFEFSIPPQTEAGIPEIELSFDNATPIVAQYLDVAITQRSALELTYREYIHGIAGPQFVLHGLEIRRIDSDVFRVRGSAAFTDLINKVFPNYVYRPGEFKGLLL